MPDRFDVIVVGAGSAGSTLATRPPPDAGAAPASYRRLTDTPVQTP